MIPVHVKRQGTKSNTNVSVSAKHQQSQVLIGVSATSQKVPSKLSGFSSAAEFLLPGPGNQQLASSDRRSDSSRPFARRRPGRATRRRTASWALAWKARQDVRELAASTWAQQSPGSLIHRPTHVPSSSRELIFADFQFHRLWRIVASCHLKQNS